ncbi:transposable element Tcb1 transposase [Trichonephila clavipes]|nr:transposable element Tcb1 transposase [Trichonephila clavipes]
MQAKNLRPTFKYGGGSQIVWSCMANSGVWNLHFIDDIRNTYAYLDILKRNLKQSASKLGISGHFKLYQDNVLKHTADICVLCVLYYCPSVIKIPAQIPDLNTIEHVWDYLQLKLYEYQISNKQDFRKYVVKEWTKIDRSFLKKLIQSMPNKLRGILKSKDSPDQFLL